MRKSLNNLEKNQIQVILKGNWDVKVTENLLIQKGEFKIYETYNRKSFSNLLSNKDHLFSLYITNTTNFNYGAIVYTSIEQVENINDYISTLVLNQKCKFVWYRNSDKDFMCLYALKINGEEGAIVTGTDIESMKFNRDQRSASNEIEIRFKESAVDLWADATKRNISNEIVFLLDNNVVAAPKVFSTITDGQAVLTGNFSQTEAKYIASLGNNGELPISFKVIK
ncbi:hypothetical protein ACFLSY_12295 [Bacteroidota bacterium]